MTRIEEVAHPEGLAAVRALREAVFVREQGIAPEDEWDDLDGVARHLLMSDGDGPVGTLRWRVVDGLAKIERVCVLARVRGTGLGRVLMERCLADLRAAGLTQAKLGAQVSAMAFYERLGFVAYGPEFDDAGIAHRWMRADL